MGIIDRLADAILKSKINISALARNSNISRAMLYKIMNKQVNGVSTKTIESICNVLNKPVEMIINGEIDKKGYKIPVLCSIPAGVPLEAIQDIDDWEEIPESWLLGGKEYFAFKVKGDSMSPKYTNGDIVIMIKQAFYDNGDDCIVYVNGQEATFKQVKKTNNGLILQPLNSAFEPLFYTDEQIESLPVRILGKAVEIRRKI